MTATIKVRIGHQEYIATEPSLIIQLLEVMGQLEHVEPKHKYDYTQTCYVRSGRHPDVQIEIGNINVVNEVPADFAKPSDNVALAEAAE